MHRMACPRHRHVELRLVCLAERGYRYADDDLVDSFALRRVARDGDALIQVERP